jgi:HD-GYP domain
VDCRACCDRKKTYPCQDEQIIKPITFLDDAIRHIRGRHGSFDGKECPDRFGGDDLLLLAKVITVADAFDAMTSNRIYRPSMKTNKAVSELKRMSGKQFDPDVVDVFAFSEIVKIDPEYTI